MGWNYNIVNLKSLKQLARTKESNQIVDDIMVNIRIDNGVPYVAGCFSNFMAKEASLNMPHPSPWVWFLGTTTIRAQGG